MKSKQKSWPLNSKEVKYNLWSLDSSISFSPISISFSPIFWPSQYCGVFLSGFPSFIPFFFFSSLTPFSDSYSVWCPFPLSVKSQYTLTLSFCFDSIIVPFQSSLCTSFNAGDTLRGGINIFHIQAQPVTIKSGSSHSLLVKLRSISLHTNLEIAVGFPKLKVHYKVHMYMWHICVIYI